MTAEAEVRPLDAAGLCVTVAELERKLRRSISGRVLITASEVATLARVAETLRPQILDTARKARP